MIFTAGRLGSTQINRECKVRVTRTLVCMTCDLEKSKFGRVEANKPSILYEIKPEMASGKLSYVHLVAGG